MGDFGRIDRATGELLVEGNLYEHPETRCAMEAYPIKTTEPTKFEKYLSKGVRELGITPSVDVGMSVFRFSFLGPLLIPDLPDNHTLRLDSMANGSFIASVEHFSYS